MSQEAGAGYTAVDAPQGPAGDAVSDSGLHALALVASFHQTECDPDQLRHELGLDRRRATSRDVARGARRLHLKARLLERQGPERLDKIPLPAILECKDGRFVIIGRRLDDGTYRIVDATTRSVDHIPLSDVCAVWAGTIILLARRPMFSGTQQKFGLGWFLPPIWRYRKPFLNVIVASILVQVCSLITPLFFQITIDKVLTHKGYSTLTMVGIGLVAIGAFQIVLQYFRSYILSHTTSRIDVELGARLFDHLLRLPLAYFESRPAGQTVARVREIETIRNFLTGQGLAAAIDIPFTLLFIVILYLYSIPLALILTLSIPVYAMIGVVIRPILRKRTIDRFNSGAVSNQFLIESIVGIHTIKAMAAEPVVRNQWEDRLAGYVRTSFDTVALATLGQNAIQYVNKVTTALILFFGAYEVMRGHLTVGALVSFNMIAGQVTAPILRLSQVWQEFQQTKISVDRLGDVMNVPPESRAQSATQLPPAQGHVSIQKVTFRYQSNLPEVIKNVTIDIPAGQVIGIVGPSGSGKSTLTKLIQRLYLPEKGQILLDGIDIAQVDPAWLRRQIGVVLQENLLFNRTIAENIAFAHPGVPRGQIMLAARLAGAEEFISRLPLGYDTPIEERGSNLSGGQRQRIAIARALVGNPRILIFDEATSALDYESEQIIQMNMKHIVKGRTVIVIAHRLAAVRRCDRIIALKDGEIVEDGSHRDLLAAPTSLYGRLWRLQSEHKLDQEAAA